jgi:dTDP-4-dehydrorhamnose 3,5-epimerase
VKILRPPELPDLVVIEPEVHRDERGFLLESWRLNRYQDAGIPGPFLQDVHSYSKEGVLRGLHYQHPDDQGKLVRVTRGRVYDVAVDVRIGSPTFGRWWGVELSEDNRRQLWIPPGFAHGFEALSAVDVQYRCTAYYAPAHARSVAWNDPTLGIDWPIASPLLSESDAAAPALAQLQRDGLLPEFMG